jgi:hypothetical protein
MPLCRNSLRQYGSSDFTYSVRSFKVTPVNVVNLMSAVPDTSAQAVPSGVMVTVAGFELVQVPYQPFTFPLRIGKNLPSL